MFSAPVLAVFIAAWQTGQTALAAPGGIWYSLPSALVLASVGMVVDLARASRLVGNSWTRGHYLYLALQGYTAQQMDDILTLIPIDLRSEG